MTAPGFLRHLLRLFPRRYRDAYGAEMWSVVRHRYAAVSGWRARYRLHLVVAADLVWSAAAVRTRRLGRVVMGGSRGLVLDLRFVLRALRRSPGFTATALLTLTVAVAVNAAVFSFVRGTLLRSPPYPEPERVVLAWGSNAGAGQPRDVVSGPNFLDLARRAESVEALAAVHPGDAVVREAGRPLSLGALDVSVDFLRVLGVSPALGRDFDDRDRTSSAPATAIVSHRFWRERLGGDPAAVGGPLRINGEPHTVLGVLPARFETVFPAPVLLPLRDDVLAADDRTHHHYWLIGRLAAGATPGGATAEMSAILHEIAAEDPRLTGWSVLVEPLERVSVEAVRPVLWLLGAATLIVLLVAITNLSGLFRIRALGRRAEMGLRVALGAGRLGVARVLLLESLGLAAVGGGVGLLLARIGLPALVGMAPTRVPIPGSAAMVPALRATLDSMVAGFIFAGALAGGVILAAAALPDRALLRGDGATARGRGRTTRRTGSAGWLVGAQLALATVLCMGAALTVRSAHLLLATDLGIEPDGVLTMYVGALDDRGTAERAAYFRRVLDRVRAVPGVASAGFSDYVPLQGEDDFEGIRFPGRPAPAPGQGVREEWRRVTESLFEAAGMRVLDGRAIRRSDTEGPPRVAVVNEAFTREHFGDDRVVGRRISITREGYRDLEIVGVVEDVRARGPAVPAPPTVYVPYQGAPRGNMALFLRVEGEPRAYVEPVREAVWSVDAGQPIDRLFPMRAMADRALAIPRLTRTVVTGLAGIAALLAAVGVFGIVGYRVGSRSRELGIRLALGATARRIERRLVLRALPLIAAGVGVGLAAGVVAARMAASVLHGVSPLDPLSMALAAGVTTGLALLATYLPARRVSAIDPAETMRAD